MCSSRNASVCAYLTLRNLVARLSPAGPFQVKFATKAVAIVMDHCSWNPLVRSNRAPSVACRLHMVSMGRKREAISQPSISRQTSVSIPPTFNPRFMGIPPLTIKMATPTMVRGGVWERWHDHVLVARGAGPRHGVVRHHA